MNKREAGLMSKSGEITIAELRRMIAIGRERGGMSRVNPQFTMEQVCDIYERSLAGREASEAPPGLKQDVFTLKMKASRDSLIIRNILRDCA